MPTVTIRDETTSGSRSDSFELTFPTESITVRELIRERIYQEVQDYNRHSDDVAAKFQGLVQPSESEVVLNGYKVRKGKQVDWKDQFAKACDAYEKNRILVLVGDRQTESIEESIELSRGVEVTFLKLVPLVGG
ncbi:MAG: hypothetical protein AABZ53_13995 [Planctomycetota bacterium]